MLTDCLSSTSENQRAQGAPAAFFFSRKEVEQQDAHGPGANASRKRASGNHQDVSAGTKGPATARSLLRGYPYHDGNRIPWPGIPVRLIRRAWHLWRRYERLSKTVNGSCTKHPKWPHAHSQQGLLSALRVYPRRINGKRLPLRSESCPKYPLLNPAVVSASPSRIPMSSTENPMLFQIHRHNRIQHLTGHICKQTDTAQQEDGAVI